MLGTLAAVAWLLMAQVQCVANMPLLWACMEGHARSTAVVGATVCSRTFRSTLLLLAQPFGCYPVCCGAGDPRGAPQ